MEVFPTTRIAGTLEEIKAVVVSAINSDRAISGIETTTTTVHSTLVSNSKVADGTTNGPEGTMEASSHTVPVLVLGRTKLSGP